MHPRDSFELVYQPRTHRRCIAGAEVVLHCHHYNSRVQRTIEGARKIDGKAIMVSSAEAAFAPMLGRVLEGATSTEEQHALIAGLYAHLGYGALVLDDLDARVITADESHFVEGWNASCPSHRQPVCSWTEGYLQAALGIISRAPVRVEETECMVSGADTCRFEVSPADHEGSLQVVQRRPSPIARPAEPQPETLASSIDERAIIDTVVAMPIWGNLQGLIPAFNVYLASTPAQLYDLLVIRFIEEMDRLGLGFSAREQLRNDAEVCGINTFQGLMSSVEWASLVQPMVREPQDVLHGLVAVSNGFGWGRWRVIAHQPAESVTLVSEDGYEASGFLEHRGASADPQCLMLTGVASGMMSLVYGEGARGERFGQFVTEETQCRTQGALWCVFDTMRS